MVPEPTNPELIIKCIFAEQFSIGATKMNGPICKDGGVVPVRGGPYGQTYVYAVAGPIVRYATESCTDRCSSQFEYNYFTETCSGSEAGSYSRLIDFVYHSTLGLRLIKRREKYAIFPLKFSVQSNVERGTLGGGSPALSKSDSVSPSRRARAWFDGCVPQT